MQSRIHWIDVLKGVGIILVIIGHTLRENSLYFWVYSFHMPLFFFLSGYLMEQKEKIIDYKGYISQKCKMLLLPFIVFRIILWAYWFVVESKYRELDLGPIWFLIILFINELIIAPILLRYRNIWHSLLLCVFCSIMLLGGKAFILVNISHSFNDAMMWLLRAFNAGIWFSAGFFIRKIVRYIPRSKWIKNIAFIFSIVASISLYRYNGNISVYSCEYGNFLLYLLLALLGISASFLLCKEYINRNRWLEWVGANTIVILAIHEPIKRILLKVCELTTHISIFDLQNSILYGGAISVIVLVLCIPIILCFKWLRYNSGVWGTYILTFVK